MTDMETFFSNLWQTYPSDLCRKKKGAKSVALKAVEKLNPDKSLREKIMSNLRELMRFDRAENKAGNNSQYWPHVATWINQERWTMIEDIGSYSEIKDKRKCACGNDTDHLNECWDCYGKTHANPYENALKEKLKSIGLWKADGETVQEWQLRCKAYTIKNGSLSFNGR